MARSTFKKKITTEESLKNINPKNKKLQELFIKDKDRKCSEATIKGYTSDLNIFFCWVEQNCENKFYPDIKRYEISDFFSYCVNDLQWNGKRFARMRSVLSNLSEIVIKYYDEDYPTFRNVINNVIEAIPKEPVREKTVVAEEELQSLLDYLFNSGKYTEACLLALAVYSGARITELSLFQVDDINRENTAFGELFLETTNKIRTKGFGKKGKMIYKYILKDLFLPYFDKYIEVRNEIVERTGTESTALFLQKNGKPAKVSTFNCWIEKWSEFLGKDLYFHAWRHMFVTTLVKQGVSKDIIMAIVGWDSDMVGVYTDIEAKDRNWDKDLEKIKGLLR